MEQESLDKKIAILETKLDFVLQELKYLREGTLKDIEILKREKADRKDLELLQTVINKDVEKRINSLEKESGRYMTMTVIYAGIGASMIGLIIYHLFN